MGRGARSRARRLVEYDGRHHRLWIRGQRCHHGATGTLVALTACLGLIAGHSPVEKQQSIPRSLAALAIAGGALMAHDWKDRSIWFERGRGRQR
jgi:hypothetical protein